MTRNSPSRKDAMEKSKKQSIFVSGNLPLPRPDLEAYESELEAALNSSPARKENYERFRLSKRKSLIDYSPIKMDIENVSRCNFRCDKCQVSSWKGLRRSRDMTLDEYRHLIDSLYGLVEIKLQGMGEPLLAGNRFFKMVML